MGMYYYMPWTPQERQGRRGRRERQGRREGQSHDAHNSLGQDVVTTAGQIGASQSNPKTAAIQVPLSCMKNQTQKDSTNSICCPFASPLARRKWHPNLGHGMRVMSIPGPRSLATRKTCPATSNFLPAQFTTQGSRRPRELTRCGL